jgi:uncharacterized protein (TIGR03437 family)
LGSERRLSHHLNGVTVYFGSYPAPILYVSPTQVAVVVPFEVSGDHRGLHSISGQFSAALPGDHGAVHSRNFHGQSLRQGLAAAINDQHNTFSYNSAANPANAGDYVEIYLTGAGQTSPAGVDGQPYAGPAPCVLPVKVTIGGVSESPQYCGGVPGQIAGLTQINVPVPDRIDRRPGAGDRNGRRRHRRNRA